MISAEENIMLSTYDNPFSPFGDYFNCWWMIDHLLIHNTCELLANRTYENDLASDEVNDRYTIEAMEQIVADFPTIYCIVRPEDYRNGCRVPRGGSEKSHPPLTSPPS